MVRALILFLLLPTYCLAYDGDFLIQRTEAGDVLIEVTEDGLSQSEYVMKVRQGMLFLFNNTTNSLLSFEFDFGESGPSCFSSITPNMEFRNGGKLLSVKPLEPGNFSSMCLPNTGEFDFIVYGLEKFPAGARGKLKIIYG